MWPFKKKTKAAPHRRAYQAAMIGRLVSDWQAQSTSMDAEIRGSLRKLRDRSREAVRDNDYARQAKRIVVNNVVGKGIPFQAQVRMQRGGQLNERINDQIEREWLLWGSKKNCHTAGTLSLCDIERMVMGSIFESGEILVRKIKGQRFGNSKVPFALELLESDLLDDDYNGVADGSKNEIRMGVELDQWKRPVAYYFLPKHPGDSTFGSVAKEQRQQHKRVPANEVIHLFLPDRLHQTRGVPMLASALLRLHNMKGYEQSEIVAARYGASTLGFIKSPEGELQGDDVVDGERVIDVDAGGWKYLAPGEEPIVPDFHRPNGQFDPFMRIMLRGVASGVGISYESISRDYSQTNYSSSRQALLEDRDNWRVLQSWIIGAFHQEIFEEWLEMAVLAGVLNLPRYETNPELYTGVRWMPRGWSWVDPMKEVQAYKEAVRNGFMTQSEVVAQSGGDFEELAIQRKRELDLADQLGLVFDTDPAADADKVAAPASAPKEAEEPEEGAEEVTE